MLEVHYDMYMYVCMYMYVSMYVYFGPYAINAIQLLCNIYISLFVHEVQHDSKGAENK